MDSGPERSSCDAWDMFGICLAHAWHMLAICLEHAWHMLGICLASGWNMLGICLAYAWNKLGVCLEYASYLMRRTQSGTALPHEKAKAKDTAPSKHLM